MSTANTDEQMRYEMLAREMYLSDLATDLDVAEKKGMAKGKIEVALNMLVDGMTIESILKYTGLTCEQIEKLAADKNKVSEPAAKYKAPRKPKAAKPRKK